MTVRRRTTQVTLYLPCSSSILHLPCSPTLLHAYPVALLCPGRTYPVPATINPAQAFHARSQLGCCSVCVCTRPWRYQPARRIRRERAYPELRRGPHLVWQWAHRATKGVYQLRGRITPLGHKLAPSCTRGPHLGPLFVKTGSSAILEFPKK